ncbi:hypothetical protein [Arthrobacter sp. OAP107]
MTSSIWFMRRWWCQRMYPRVVSRWLGLVIRSRACSAQALN